jgi:transcriptional regulator with XRE-family HTH domain
MTLRAARVALGWTQPRLAEKSGVSQQQISRFENAQIEKVSLDDARAIAKAFHKAGLKGVTVDELFPVPAERAS